MIDCQAYAPVRPVRPPDAGEVVPGPGTVPSNRVHSSPDRALDEGYFEGIPIQAMNISAGSNIKTEYIRVS